MKKMNKELYRTPFSDGKKWFLISMISMVILSAYNLIISWLLQKIIDLAAGIDKTPFYQLALVSLVSFIVFIVFYFIFRYAHPKFLQTLSTSYKDLLFAKILRNNSRMVSEIGSGQFLSKLSNDLKSIEENYFDFYITLIDIGISFVGAIVLMLWYSPVLTMVAIALSILPLLVSIPASKEITRTEKNLSKENAGFMEFMRDTLSGYFVIKSFHAESELENRFHEENIEIEKAKFFRRFAEENINLLSTAASVVMRLGVFLFGAWLSLSNRHITPGIVLAFLQLLTFVITPIEKIPSLFANRKAARSLIAQTEELFYEKPDEMERIEKDSLKSTIEIQNLSFSYEASVKALRNVSLTFHAGKKYAIVGASGSGKSTLFKLLTKYSSDYDGNILFDGIELRNITYSSLSQIISVVQQNVFVFHDSIYNNICLYKSIPEEKFDYVIQKSGLSSLIQQKGKNFSCGANGSKLSGGEKQRISIARALLRNTSILLMDEASSALDEKTADEIMNSILDMPDITSLVITHRLNSTLLKKYDGIFVLHHGKIVEFGAFDELMKNKGLLYSLILLSQS
ncbi:ABC transporter ATP-binding protein [Oribacterium parvum]|uniref:ABC transporter ATP-binding protein n=1 Tax=Oribacterium parvum TaxID=1501329 RepID=UPI0028EE325F|nr:ABC transporter ATP-binding protein [Oribacterium parvum]